MNTIRNSFSFEWQCRVDCRLAYQNRPKTYGSDRRKVIRNVMTKLCSSWLIQKCIICRIEPIDISNSQSKRFEMPLTSSQRRWRRRRSASLPRNHLFVEPYARSSQLALCNKRTKKCQSRHFSNVFRTIHHKISRESTSQTSNKKKAKATMVADMSYSTVSSVLDTWEKLRRIPDYEEKTGTILFKK